jgi:hypothetical protein
MPYINLDRRFVEWTQDQQPTFAYRGILKRDSWTLGWDQILDAKRVVILAEGGSGKSEELREQHRRLHDEGRFSFFLTVKKAGENGIKRSLNRLQQDRLGEWRASTEPAWFFLDSIDEAKGAHVSLSEALENLADAVSGAGFRAHIVFSGRPSEWEFRKDLDSLVELLPSPELPPPSDPIDSDDIVLRAYREHNKPQPKSRGPLVTLMAPLDERRVKIFAACNGVGDMPGFWTGLADFDLWSFASRPLDLGWLTKYWKSHQKFDRLEQMLRANLTERLRENSSERARKTQIEPGLAMQCLETVGGALVLGQQRDIAIPNGEVFDVSNDALRLNEILDDLSPEKLADFTNAAVFVAAGPGVIRLHNDNDGVVSSYLAAAWLLRLLRNHCPRSVAHDLMFAESYGVAVVKPSMLSTAVWLSLWETWVAEEVAKRAPFALLDSGDPFSLPLDIRRKVLRAVLADIKARRENSFLANEGLKRFAQADLEQDIQELWKQCGHDQPARALLLQLIREGKLRGCASLAYEAAASPSSEPLVRSLAAQAIARAGDDAMKQDFSTFLRREAANIDPGVLWNAIDWLGPRWFTPDDAIVALPALLSNRQIAGAGFDHYGPSLAQRIDKVDEATRLLRALLHELPTKADNDYANDFDQLAPIMPTIAELAKRIVELRGPPAEFQMAIDALLRLKAVRQEPHWRAESMEELGDCINKTSAGRQALLWRFAETYDRLGWTVGEPLTHLGQINAARLPLALTREDLDWLLDAISRRADANDKLLALNLTMSIWRQEGDPAEILRRVDAVVEGVPELSSALSFWTKPPTPSAALIRMNEEHEKYLTASSERRKQEDDWWIQFASSIRNNPEQLGNLTPPSAERVDYRLLYIRQLLDRLNGKSHSLSISDVSLLTPIFGARALPHIHRAFVAYWRLGTPALRCDRPAEMRNVGNAMEFIGLIGLAMESSKNDQWAEGLSSAEARLAAIYATLELNAFPRWFGQLAAAHPDPVRSILGRALAPELAGNANGPWKEMLERVVRADGEILTLAAPLVFEWLAASPDASTQTLSLASRIVIKAQHRLQEMLALMVTRAAQEGDATRAAIHLSRAYAIDGDAACETLARIRGNLSPLAAASFAETLLPAIFGSAFHVGPPVMPFPMMSTKTLVDLIKFAFEALPLQDDRERPFGQAYSPDSRDHAQRARDASINILASRPGAATHAALLDLAKMPDFSAITEWLAHLAINRARLDAESAPWLPHDVSAFEKDFQTVPRTPADLQRLAAARIEDLQRDLIAGDFSQAVQVSKFAHEVEAQLWLAHEFDVKRGRSFTVARERHVAQEKEPDVTLTSSVTGALLPIEIKIAESWSLTQLEEALTVQLRQYLRDSNAQWGILLLFHCIARTHGWETADGNFMSFAQTVEHLRKIASAISASNSAGHQMQVCTIDVSSIGAKASALPKRAARKPKAKSKADQSQKP